MSSDPIAYTYNADYHCPPCTFKAFGQNEHGFPPENAQDSEGNPIGAVAPWDEWYANDIYEGRDCAVLACGTCGEVIEEKDLTE